MDLCQNCDGPLPDGCDTFCAACIWEVVEQSFELTDTFCRLLRYGWPPEEGSWEWMREEHEAIHGKAQD